MAASGGEPREVTTFDSPSGESSHRYPEVLPGGRVIMFTAGPPLDGPWHEADIVAQSLDTGERHTLIPSAAQARYVAPEYIVYARAGTLYAVPFDATSVRVKGPPVAVLEGVREDPRHGAAQFVVSAKGTLAYVSGGLETTEVVLVDRQGLDGRWLAYVSNESGSNEVYVQEFRPGGLTWRVSKAGGTEPVWSRDSQRLYFREDFKLLAVAAPPPFAGAVELFETPWAFAGNGRWYDVAPDGESFFMIRRDQSAARIHVILNWVEELKRRVPR